MLFSNRRSLGLLAVLGATAAIVAACTQAPATTSAPPTQSASTAAAATAATTAAPAAAASPAATSQATAVAAAAAPSGSLGIGMDSFPAEYTLAISGTGTLTNRYFWPAFDALTRMSDDAELLPGLAERWETSDAVTWTFRLREACGSTTERRSLQRT